MMAMMQIFIAQGVTRFSVFMTTLCFIGMAFMMTALISQAHAAGDLIKGAAVSKKCISCHGETGTAPINGYPRLAGQKQKYLVKQIDEIRQSAKQHAGMLSEDNTHITKITRAARSNVTMDPYIVNLSDQEMIDVAAYYSSLPCRQDNGIPPIATTPPTPPKAEMRCRTCHGMHGISDRDTIPNIAGQDVTYLIRQLKTFSASTKHDAPSEGINRRTPIMASQAKYLSPPDIMALANYYAQLPCN